ncbi:MAG: adenylate/guanylate cyclase domain-containing protein [Verrucomicrobiota bacterium]
MSFRLKLILTMAALVSGVSITALFVNEQNVQRQFGQLVDERLVGQAESLKKGQAARLQGVRDRIRDASRSVRIAAALMEESEDQPRQVYGDFGEELEEVLGSSQSTIDAFFRVFDYENRLIPDPDPMIGLDEKKLTEKLVPLLPSLDAEVLETESGYLVLEAEEKTSLYETIVHPVFDVSGEFLCILIIAFRVSDPQLLMDKSPGVKVALDIAGNRFGDPIPDGDIVAIDGQRHEVRTQVVEQGTVFKPASLIAAFSLKSLEQARAQLRKSLLIFGVCAFVLGVVLSTIISSQIVKPLSELTRQTREILAGHFGATIPVRSRDEVGVLTESFNEMSEGLALKEKYRAVLDRVTDPRVADELTQGELELGGEERIASILFCDIRGFTSLTEDMSPHDVVAMLNAHMTALTEVAAKHNGVVDKFIGDEIMILFGAPHAYENDALDAVSCAIEMTKRRRELNKTTSQPILIGIGVATGPILAGCMGSENRLNYTALGARVNLAARLCSRATPLEILVDEDTYLQVKDNVAAEAVGEVELKGFRENNQAYRINSE